MTEDEWTAQLIALARLTGWRVVHFRPARTARGWRTPVQGDGKGWPDLVLLRGQRLIAAELKTDTGRATAEQLAWLDAFALVGAETYLWRPCDWEAVQQVLSNAQTHIIDVAGPHRPCNVAREEAP